MGAPTIATGLCTQQPLCFAKDRRNILYMANGFDRPRRWDGVTSAVELMGITAPASAPGASSSSGGALSAGAYTLGYQYMDDEKPNPVCSSLSPTTTITVAEADKITWTFALPTESRVTTVRLWRSTAGQSEALYKIADITVVGSYSAVANNGSGFARFTMYNHNVAVGSTLSITTVSGGAYTGTHTVTAVNTSTGTFDTNVAFSSTGTGTWGLATYTNDTTQDSTLRGNAVADPNTVLRILTKGGQLNARRYGVPSNTKPYMAFFQDRLFLAGVTEYTTGTVSTTAGSATVTGSGTAWFSTLAGRYIAIQGETQLHLISSVGGATSITLATQVSTTLSGVAYCILPSPEEYDRLYYSEIDEPESIPDVNAVDLQENTGRDDHVTGLMPTPGALFVLKDFHVYRLTFFAQPVIDVAVNLAASRGCVNNRCWVRFEGYAYLMDHNGIYRFGGAGAEPISQPIDDLFNNGGIAWGLSKWFFAEADEQTACIRFYVQLTGDDGTRPMRWLEYNVRSEEWTTGSTVYEVGGSTKIKFGNVTRCILGGENDYLYLNNQGYCDHVTAATQGTATAGGNNSLTDATATFVAGMVGAPLSIVYGTGAGQTRRISAQTATQLTVSSNWTTNPDSTSVYVVGGIPFQYKFGRFKTIPTEEEEPREMKVTFAPTGLDQYLNIRRYLNAATSAANHELPKDVGRAITTTKDSPNAVLNMKLSRSTKGDATGVDIFRFPGRTDEDGMGTQHIALEFTGAQGLEPLLIYEADIRGLST